MSVDKFGRHEEFIKRKRNQGPPGDGFLLTGLGHYDMNNRLLRRVGTPKASHDAVNLRYVTEFCLMKQDNQDYDCKGCSIRNIKTPILPSDAANMDYVDGKSIKKIDNEKFNFEDYVLSNVRDAEADTDAVNLRTLKKELNVLSKNHELRLERLGAALFRYIHKNKGNGPVSEDSVNFLDWDNIHGKHFE